MERIVLLDEVTWCEDADGKVSVLDCFSGRQDMLAIQSLEELTSSLHASCQYVEVLGMYERGVLLKHILRRYRENIPVYLYKIFVETGERPLWEVSFEGVKSLQDYEKSGLGAESSCLTSVEKKSRTALLGVGACYQD